ncbi:acetolactate synthase catalytic subunit [Microbaculum marinum]|uniref:Acetolactate synthase catalytic subunit n=1 Tax=Microbaculum marinum TaxID=1764581 RepID=A0AAW9RR50_9HYPH
MHRKISGNVPVGGQRLARAFARHGVRVAFGQSIPSIFHLVAPAHGIIQAVYRTENAGGAMADAYARVSNRIALVTAQNGPAATLLVAPLAEALKASVPVVALVQEVTPDIADRNAFQELDHSALFSGVAKWIRRIDDVDRIDDYVDLAVTTATTGRPGPVVLLVPGHILSATARSDSGRGSALGTFPLDRVAPDAENVHRAAKLIAGARRPLVIAGGGVHLSAAQAALAELQDRHHLPVATTLMGKGAVAEDHPLSLGVIGYFMGDGARTEKLHEFVQAADVIVLIGNRTNQNGTDSWRLYPREAACIHLDIDGQEIGRNYEALRLVGDAGAGIAALSGALDRLDLADRIESRAGFEAEIAAAVDHFRTRFAELSETGSAVRPESVMRELDRVLTPETTVVSDASYASIWTGNFLTARRPGMRFISPRGLAGLGWGLPMAIGAKIARPNDPVVCVTGDGGFAHCWAELETAVRMELSIPVIVLNNQILGYQKDAEDMIFGAHTEACHFAPVDHAVIATGCGARGIRVTDPGDLPDALAEALAHPGPTVMDVITDPHARPPLTFYRGRFRDAP